MTKKMIVGVDLGGTTTKMAFIDLNGTIIEKWEIPTDHSNEGQNITTNIARAIDHKLQELSVSKDQLLGVGMGAPGPVNYGTGVIINAVNLGWKDHYPLQSRLKDATTLPVIIENDANCAALGEMWNGAGKGAKDLVCVTLGTGVGGGVIANGDIVRGINGAGGEIGHVTVIPKGGAHCNCGKTGCLETVASATGIVRLAQEELAKGQHSGQFAEQYAQNGQVTAKDVFDAARNNDATALQILEQMSLYLGFALAGIANTLNPDKIVISGGVSKAGSILLDAVQEQFDQFAFSAVKDSTKLTLATLGNDAGVTGAAWLIKKHLNL